jgi:hypothetical protein
MSFFFVSGFGSGAYSAKLLNGTRQRFSGLAGRASVAITLLRMLATGGPIESNRLMGVAAEALHFQIQVPRIRASPALAMAGLAPERRACSRLRRRAGRLPCALLPPAQPMPGLNRRKSSLATCYPCAHQSAAASDRQIINPLGAGPGRILRVVGVDRTHAADDRLGEKTCCRRLSAPGLSCTRAGHTCD